MNERRNLLLARAACIALSAAAGTMAPVSLQAVAPGLWMPALTQAMADSGSGRGGDDGGGRGGDHGDGGSGSGGDDGGNSGSGGEGGDDQGSGSGSGGGSDSGEGADDSGGDEGGSDDDASGGSGHGGDTGSDHGGTSGRSSDDSGDGDGSGGDVGRAERGDDADRPSARVDLEPKTLDSILRGERVLIDDRGRVLEVEIEVEHGVRTVTVKPHGGDARRNPGPIAGLRTVEVERVPGSTVTVDPNGGIEVEVEHGAAVTKPHGSPQPHANDRSGADLSPDEELALIRSGWR